MANNAIAGENADMRHEMAVVETAERALDKMEVRAGLSPAGRAWVTLAADPFHDTAVDIDGLPDYRTHRTITQVITRTNRYTVPVVNNTPLTVPWALSIFSTPWNQTTAVYPFSIIGQQLTISTAPYTGQGGTITMASSGSTSNIYPPDGTDPTLTLDGLSPTIWATTSPTPTDNFTSGQHRLIAAGFEVYMTGSTLVDSGDVVVWKQPSTTVERYAIGTQGSIPPTGCVGVYTRGPPASAQEAMTIPGARRWRAKDGCYVPLLLNDEDIPFRPCLPTFFANVDRTIAVSSNTTTTPALGITPIHGLSTASQLNGPDSLSQNYFHCAGAHFDGIDPKCTLTVVARFVVEREPSVSESDLIVLARPSPPADEIAWRIYSEMVRSAPAGAPVRDNALGAWFANLVGDLAQEVVPVAGDFLVKKALGGARKKKKKTAAAPLVAAPRRRRR